MFRYDTNMTKQILGLQISDIPLCHRNHYDNKITHYEREQKKGIKGYGCPQ
jgi:hypothetical protein